MASQNAPLILSLGSLSELTLTSEVVRLSANYIPSMDLVIVDLCLTCPKWLITIEVSHFY